MHTFLLSSQPTTSGFFSTIFRQLQANTCRNSELEEILAELDGKIAELGQGLAQLGYICYVFT